MTTLQIDSNDQNAIAEIKSFVMQKFHFNVQIVNDFDTTKLNVKSKTKWAEFAEKMDGLFTPDIVKHISGSRKEARDNFLANI